MKNPAESFRRGFYRPIEQVTIFRTPDLRTNLKDLQRLIGLFVRLDLDVFHAGGMAACSRWPSEVRATPPENRKNKMHPGGMPARSIQILLVKIKPGLT